MKGSFSNWFFRHHFNLRNGFFFSWFLVWRWIFLRINRSPCCCTKCFSINKFSTTAAFDYIRVELVHYMIHKLHVNHRKVVLCWIINAPLFVLLKWSLFFLTKKNLFCRTVAWARVKSHIVRKLYFLILSEIVSFLVLLLRKRCKKRRRQNERTSSFLKKVVGLILWSKNRTEQKLVTQLIFQWKGPSKWTWSVEHCNLMN